MMGRCCGTAHTGWVSMRLHPFVLYDLEFARAEVGSYRKKRAVITRFASADASSLTVTTDTPF